MKKGKRYKNNKLTNFLWFYTIVSTLLIFGYTFSRYLAIIEPDGIIKIAKFNVKVNDKNVIENEAFILNLITNSNAYEKKFIPESNGYFNFIINPAGTEVSLEYEFKFDLEELNENFKLLYFTINDSETHYSIIDNNIVKETLALPSKEKAFTDDNITTIKVYWSWNDKTDNYNPDINTMDNKDIGVTAIVKQKI